MVCNRYAELSCWLISKESQLRLLRNRANDPRKYGQVKTTITVSPNTPQPNSPLTVPSLPSLGCVTCDVLMTLQCHC